MQRMFIVEHGLVHDFRGLGGVMFNPGEELWCWQVHKAQVSNWAHLAEFDMVCSSEGKETCSEHTLPHPEALCLLPRHSPEHTA